jgi:hypothetical protein
MSARESFDHADATNLIAPRAAAETLRTLGSDFSRRGLKASEKRVWLPLRNGHFYSTKSESSRASVSLDIGAFVRGRSWPRPTLKTPSRFSCRMVPRDVFGWAAPASSVMSFIGALTSRQPSAWIRIGLGSPRSLPPWPTITRTVPHSAPFKATTIRSNTTRMATRSCLPVSIVDPGQPSQKPHEKRPQTRLTGTASQFAVDDSGPFEGRL